MDDTWNLPTTLTFIGRVALAFAKGVFSREGLQSAPRLRARVAIAWHERPARSKRWLTKSHLGGSCSSSSILWTDKLSDWAAMRKFMCPDTSG